MRFCGGSLRLDKQKNLKRGYSLLRLRWPAPSIVTAIVCFIVLPKLRSFANPRREAHACFFSTCNLTALEKPAPDRYA
jgi:hypothetical protein